MPETTHKLNGVTVMHDEPYPFLDQAHALAIMTECALRGEAENGSLNDDLVAAALRGIGSLIELTSIGLAKMDADREARRG